MLARAASLNLHQTMCALTCLFGATSSCAVVCRSTPANQHYSLNPSLFLLGRHHALVLPRQLRRASGDLFLLQLYPSPTDAHETPGAVPKSVYRLGSIDQLNVAKFGDGSWFDIQFRAVVKTLRVRRVR